MKIYISYDHDLKWWLVYAGCHIVDKATTRQQARLIAKYWKRVINQKG